MEEKEFKTIDEQLEILKSRGLIVKNDVNFSNVLSEALFQKLVKTV